jgi:hypothetical protein
MEGSRGRPDPLRLQARPVVQGSEDEETKAEAAIWTGLRAESGGRYTMSDERITPEALDELERQLGSLGDPGRPNWIPVWHALRNSAPALISAARENLTQRERIAELEAEVARRAETIRELTAGEVSAAEYCCGEVKQQLCAENAALTRKLAEVGRERNELQQRAGLPDARTLAEPGIDCMDPSGHRASVRRGISRSSCVC